MGSKNKLKRFKENNTFCNVVQPLREALMHDPEQWRGNWRKAYFNNENPIILELGCGKGEYTTYLAQKNANHNYIGIDIKGARFWRGAKNALELGLDNVLFIRTQIELIGYLFAESEVDQIWITFPDPQIKFKRTKHRLINSFFLEQYKNILKPEGVLHLKTDSEFLFGYTLGILKAKGILVLYANHDVYNNAGAAEDVLAIQTFYEKKYLEQGKPITYIQFQFV